MALKKEAIQRIAALAKIPVADLENALKDTNEVDLVIDDKIQAYTEAEVKTLESNHYNRGKDAGVEMEIKEAKTKHGLDFTGKTIEGLLGAYKGKVIADEKIAPDQKVKDLETQVTALKNTVGEYEKKLADKDTEVSGIKTKSELLRHIPAASENGPGYEPDDIIVLMERKGYEFKTENNVLKISKDGQVLLDKLGNPQAAKDVVTGFMKEKKLIAEEGTPPGGRGGSDKKPAGAKALKLSELKKQFQDEGKNLQGEEFSKAVAEAAKDADFDMNA